MPAGAWRDIVNTMRALPAWKLCLDIEPASWDVLLRDDPGAYHELADYLESTRRWMRAWRWWRELSHSPMVGPSAARAISASSRAERRSFAVTSRMRRLSLTPSRSPVGRAHCRKFLLSLGFTGAVLKDPGTAWGGYSAGFDAELVNWTGPDGSAIAAVPRYACEELRKVYETESGYATPEFAEKCVAHGIPHPAGMYFQDLGLGGETPGLGRLYPLCHLARIHSHRRG